MMGLFKAQVKTKQKTVNIAKINNYVQINSSMYLDS